MVIDSQRTGERWILYRHGKGLEDFQIRLYVHASSEWWNDLSKPVCTEGVEDYRVDKYYSPCQSDSWSCSVTGLYDLVLSGDGGIDKLLWRTSLAARVSGL